MKIKKEHIFLFFIFLFGICIRVILFRNESFIGIDGSILARLGKNLVENGRYVFCENYNWGLFFPPGYPVLVGTINSLINNLFVSGKLISLFSSIVTIFLLYLTGKELHSKESGLFAAFVFSIHTSILGTSVSVATEGYFLCLVFLSVYLYFVSLRKNKFFIYVLLGLSIGMSYLTRPEGILLLILPFLSLDTWNPFHNKKRLLNMGTTLLMFILISSPYLFFIKDSTGRFSLSGKSSYLGVILAEGVSSEEIEYDIAAYSLNEHKTALNAFDLHKQSSVIDYILDNPMSFMLKYSENLKKAIKIQIKLLFPVLLPFLLVLFKRELFREKKFWTLILLSILFIVIYPPFLVLTRHMFIAALLLIMISSVGFAQSRNIFSDLFASHIIKKNIFVRLFYAGIKYIIIILSVLASTFNVSASYVSTKKDIPIEHVKAAHFLRNNIASEYEKLNVMHRTPWVSFYSGARYTMFPYANYGDAIRFAKLHDVDFIVVDNRSSMKNWKYYDELISLEENTDDVELVYEDNSGKLIKLFRVKY